MWHIFFKKISNIKKNNLFKIVRKLKNNFLIVNFMQLIIKNIFTFLRHSNTPLLMKKHSKNVLNVMGKVAVLKKIFYKSAVHYKIQILFKFKKRQLYTIITKTKIIFSTTNGILNKKLNPDKKSLKKQNKITLFNISKTFNYCYSNRLNNIIIVCYGLKYNTINVMQLIKKFSKKTSTIVTITPAISFLKNNYKKIKSIKRKLRKKYLLVNN